MNGIGKYKLNYNKHYHQFWRKLNINIELFHVKMRECFLKVIFHIVSLDNIWNIWRILLLLFSILQHINEHYETWKVTQLHSILVRFSQNIQKRTKTNFFLVVFQKQTIFVFKNEQYFGLFSKTNNILVHFQKQTIF